MRIKLKDPIEFKKTLIVNGFSQTELAKSIEVTPVYMHQIVKQDRYPSAKIAKKISTLLGMEFEDIFFIDDAC